ncbi:OsmC family protein [Bdellovibrionota bacterium FG-2]
MNLTLTWNDKMSFEADIRGKVVPMDVKPESGGDDSGPTPKELVLAGLAGCTGMDVAYVLNKMRAEFSGISIDADAQTTKGEPSVFDTVHLIYNVTSPSLPEDKLMRAVELSQTKYCGVSAMIAKSARINYEVRLNGKTIGTGAAKF